MPKTDDQIKAAKNDARRHNIPWEAYEAFRIQYHNAKRRKIPLLFTLPEWWAWWQQSCELGGPRWNWRGLKGDGLVMCRHGDKGPYSPDNVYCERTSKNIQDADMTSAGDKHRARWATMAPEEKAKWHLAVRGDGHPKSKAVITPKGRFGSMALAAEAHGLTRAGAHYRLKRGEPGWYYEGDAVADDHEYKLAAD